MKPTIYDIANKANISYAAVSTIMNSTKPHRYAAKTVNKVRQIARELGYQRNHFAKSLKEGKTNLIGVTVVSNVLAEFDHPYTSRIYRGIGEFFSTKNYQLIFQHFQELVQPGNYLDLAKSRTVDGLVIVLLSRDVAAFQARELYKIRETGIPFVIVHTLLYDLDCPVVGVDCIQGGRTVVGHLLGHGYDSVGIVYDPAMLHFTDFFTGYKQGLERHGRGVNPEFVYTFSDYSRDTGYDLASRLLAENRPLPRALFVVDDLIADGMFKRFIEAGIRVPQDVALIGFGDVDEGSSYFTGLTSLRQPAVEKGYKAAGLLLELIEHPEERNKTHKIFIEPELTIRKTCGCG